MNTPRAIDSLTALHRQGRVGNDGSVAAGGRPPSCRQPPNSTVVAVSCAMPNPNTVPRMVRNRVGLKLGADDKQEHHDAKFRAQMLTKRAAWGPTTTPAAG